MKPSPLLLACAAALPLLAAPAWAQENDYTRSAGDSDRVDRLERDIMLLQRQIARGRSNGSTVTYNAATEADIPAGGAAQLEVRLSGMEDQLRALQGKLEENEFQVRKLNESFEKFRRGTEFRFSERPGTPAAADAPATEGGAKAPVDLKDQPATEQPATDASASGETAAGKGVLETETPGEDKAATPRDLYNYAFRLLNQTQYAEAADAFQTFIKKYPKDPLVGNAYYWLGETHYIRRDYVTAADSFRQGFEVLPGGPKAADNLLKLAMSLDALNRNKEACVVLGQITTKFKTTSTTINAKAEQEQKRIGCK